MQKKVKILLIPIVIVFIYLVIFFGVFIFRKGELNLEENVDSNIKSYGYGQTQSLASASKNSKYSSVFSPKYGNKNAKISVIMFYDFDCVYSWHEYSVLYNVIKKYYNKGYFEFRNFALESVHPNARMLANASLCANEQAKFLEMFNEIFLNFSDRESNSTDINETIKEYGKNIELDMIKFNTCMSELKYNKTINKDIVDAVNFGVEGTPTFFINGQMYPGVIKEEDWDNVFKNIK